MIINLKTFIEEYKLPPDIHLLEILSLLLVSADKNKVLHINGLYELLSKPKPTFVTFRSKLRALEKALIITIEQSDDKNSMKNVNLNHKMLSSEIKAMLLPIKY